MLRPIFPRRFPLGYGFGLRNPGCKGDEAVAATGSSASMLWAWRRNADRWYPFAGFTSLARYERFLRTRSLRSSQGNPYQVPQAESSV
jgi:hypothetical protein